MVCGVLESTSDLAEAFVRGRTTDRSRRDGCDSVALGEGSTASSSPCLSLFLTVGGSYRLSDDSGSVSSSDSSDDVFSDCTASLSTTTRSGSSSSVGCWVSGISICNIDSSQAIDDIPLISCVEGMVNESSIEADGGESTLASADCDSFGSCSTGDSRSLLDDSISSFCSAASSATGSTWPPDDTGPFFF